MLVGQTQTRWKNLIKDLERNSLRLQLSDRGRKWWKTKKYGGLISSYCTQNSHKKLGKNSYNSRNNYAVKYQGEKSEINQKKKLLKINALTIQPAKQSWTPKNK